ncbi:MAG: HAD family phosphatase, partial [Verrucomicrobiota bacterium]
MKKQGHKAWAVIFDWDGVIIDSSRQHEQSWDIVAERYGLPLPEGHFKRGFGMKNEKIIPEVLQWTTEPEEVRKWADIKEATYREIITADGLEPLPGVTGLLDGLMEREIPCAVGSSTPRENLECALGLLGFRDAFRELVAGDDVVNGKPAPDIFLTAAERLGIEPGQSIVIEDAHVGIEAAKRAGMPVVAV